MEGYDGRRFLAMMTSVHFVNDGFEMIVPTLLPVISVALSLSYSQIGLVGGALVVSMGLGQVFVGAFSDYFGHKKRLIIAGLVLVSVAFLIMAASQGFYSMFAANLLAGFGLSIYHPVGVAMIANRYDAKQGKAMGVHGSGGNAGMFLFPLLAGVLADIIGWRLALATFPVLGLLMALLYALVVREEPFSLSAFEPRKLLIPALAAIILAMGLFNMAVRGFIVFFPVTLGGIGTGSAMTGGFMSLFFGVGIIGQYVGGWLSDNREMRTSIAAISAISAVAMYVAIQSPDMSSIMVPALIVAGLGVHMVWPLFFVIYSKTTPAGMRGTGLGAFFSMGYLFASASPVMMGHIGTAFTPSASHVVIVVTGICCAVVMSLMRLRRL
jgi:MFS family permease